MILRNIFRDKRPCLGQDPYVTMLPGGTALLCESVDERRITISILESVQNPIRSASTVVWERKSERQVWAPELHRIHDFWYIYYAASDGYNKNHRPYVLKSNKVFGPYEFCGRIGSDIWAIDMTQFKWKDIRYAVWSGWEKNGDEFPQNLYIGVMDSPLEIQERIKLSTPELRWENSISPILEGPQAWINKGKLSILYSGNASWRQEYSTGLLTMVGENPLDPADWKKRSTPLSSNAGHGCIVDGYFVYQRKISTFPGWRDREIVSVRIEELGIW